MANDLSSQLRAHLNQEPAKDDSPRDTFGEVTRLITSITGAEEPEREDKLEDLGVSSLELIEFAVRAEQKFGVKLGEKTVTEFSTVADVARYIDTHAEKP